MKIVISVLLVGAMFVGCSEDKDVSKSQRTVIKTPQKVVEKSDDVAQKVQVIVDKVVEKTEVAVVEIKKTINGVAKDVQEATTTVDEGAKIYKVCSACHGASGDKPALGKSKVIKGWSTDRVQTALNGYKDGSYGGTMKALMKGQVSKLSDDEIKAVSEYISKL